MGRCKSFGSAIIMWVCAGLLSLPGFSQKPVAAPVSVWTVISEKAAGAPDTGYNTYKAALRERAILQAYYRYTAACVKPYVAKYKKPQQQHVNTRPFINTLYFRVIIIFPFP